ncbi:MAG: AsmA family protein [Xanthomonadaceae bacterium]|nr:AsmA family protein [Xanthomonadaceae bacterium]
MKLIKWVVITLAVFVLLLIAAVIVLPHVVDVQKFKPRIEKMASEATGRPLTLGGEMKLSLFPWVGVSLADVQLGNPAGFTDKNMLTVKSFEVSVKLLPLLSRDIQVKKLLLDGTRLSLEKLKNGRGNWEGIGQSDRKAVAQEKKEGVGESAAGLPITSLAVGEIAITNGKIVWEDHAAGVKKEISAINLRMRDVSLDNPVQLAFSADVDGQPLSLQGEAGPLGVNPGTGTLPFDFVLKVTNQLKVSMKGKVVDPLSKQKFDLILDLAAFSPRKLAAALGRDFLPQTADPQVFDLLGVHAGIAGSPEDIVITDGTMELDDSHIIFSAHLSEFSRPRIQCDLELDQIDVDRYLPPAEEKTAGQKKPSGVSAAGKKKIDYTPLRKLLLDGKFKAGKVKVHGVGMQDVVMKISGKKGVFQLNPLTLNLYQGSVSSTGRLNVQRDIPRSSFNVQLKDIQVGPLLKDSIHKDFLEGTLASRVELTMTGDEPERIKRSLNGKGNISLKDGAVIGVDLAAMARNIKSGLQLNGKTSEKPRTDFAELNAPFTIVNGIVDTPGTTMISPFLRLSVVGKADVPQESLDFRVKPKIVKTLKGQGDTKQRSGLVVPLLVSGTFSAPKIRPDLQGMIGKDMPDVQELKKMIADDGAAKEKVKSIKKDLKGMLKGFSPGK